MRPKLEPSRSPPRPLGRSLQLPVHSLLLVSFSSRNLPAIFAFERAASSSSRRDAPARAAPLRVGWRNGDAVRLERTRGDRRAVEEAEEAELGTGAEDRRAGRCWMLPRELVGGLGIHRRRHLDGGLARREGRRQWSRRARRSQLLQGKLHALVLSPRSPVNHAVQA